MGEIGGGWWNGLYLDYFLLLTFGGIPWQVRQAYNNLLAGHPNNHNYLVHSPIGKWTEPPCKN